MTLEVNRKHVRTFIVNAADHWKFTTSSSHAYWKAKPLVQLLLLLLDLVLLHPRLHSFHCRRHHLLVDLSTPGAQIHCHRCLADPINVTNTNTNNNNNNTLYYNLALNVSIRNPNKKAGVYYNRIQAIGNYGKKRFALVNTTSTPFYQGHKNTTMVRFVLQGQQVVVLGGKELSRFNSETSARVYNIDVKLAPRIKARYGKIKTAYFKPPKVDCQLKLPLSTIYNNGTSVGPKFVSKECGSVKIFTISVGIEIGPFSFETG
ncbi:hypothetical protein GBA52_023782 [Prunus armeniaca]|nr:hypothetical protein GBA52_023782 [Prunus armeniaca]